jgi:PAS domain S-box-containing protein
MTWSPLRALRRRVTPVWPYGISNLGAAPAQPGPELAGTASPVSDTLFELAPDAIIVADGGGVIVRVNAQVERIFGYPRAEVVGRAVETLLPEQLRAAHVQHRARFREQPRRREMGPGLELTGRRRDGSEFPVAVALAPLDEGGVIAIARDVTEQRAVERALRGARDDLERRIEERTRELLEVNASLHDERQQLFRADRLASLGVLASSIAHEIKNPLAGVTGLVRALRAGAVTAQREDEYLAAIVDGLERMHSIVQTTLDFARSRAPERSCFPVVDVLDSCRRLLAPVLRDRDVELVLVQLDGVVLDADRSLLLQAILNVIMNAVYAAPPRTAVTASAVLTEGRCGIRISDQGPGIPPGDLHRIGEPFFTTRPGGEGTGLGLSITRNILRAHGGDLAIESTVGAGTDVILWVPRAPGDASRR